MGRIGTQDDTVLFVAARQHVCTACSTVTVDEVTSKLFSAIATEECMCLWGQLVCNVYVIVMGLVEPSAVTRGVALITLYDVKLQSTYSSVAAGVVAKC